MLADRKKCFSLQAAASQKPGHTLHEIGENFNRKSPPGREVLYLHMLLGDARLCLSGFSHISLLCLTRDVANLCSPPAQSMLMWPGVRAATAEPAGDVLFLRHFGTHLCSFSSRAVGPPCLSSLGGPAHLSISRHVGLSLVAPGHIKFLFVTPVVDHEISFLHNSSPLVSLCLYHKVSNRL